MNLSSSSGSPLYGCGLKASTLSLHLQFSIIVVMYFSSSSLQVIFFLAGCPTLGSLSLSSELCLEFPAAVVYFGGGYLFLRHSH